MKEFSQKGYANASTDVIVKEADISKGSLFYYFKNKKDLFLFLYDYAINIVKKGIINKLDLKERDVFFRRRQAAALKIEILKKHPEIYDFLTTAYVEDANDVRNDLEKRNKKLISEGQTLLNKDIDTSKFKEDVEVKRAVEIITWTTDGFTNKEMAKIKNNSSRELNLNELFNEMDVYLEMLKKSFYK